MEPSSPPPPPPPSTTDKKPHQSRPHARITIPGSLVGWWQWWIPSSPPPPIFLLTLISFSTLLFSFSAASDLQPTPTRPASPPTQVINARDTNQGRFNSTLFVAAVSVAAAVALFLALFAMVSFSCFGFRIPSRKNRVINDDGDVESDVGSKMDFGVRRLSWDDVRVSTNGFEKVIGSGGFSVVYCGALPVPRPPFSKPVGAFKVHSNSERLHQGFREELSILLKLDHPNIVKLHAYCDDQEGGALVFEYVPNGTLQENLHESSRSLELPWSARVSVAYQLALALEYLHEQCELHVVHGDVKSSNILLDKNLNVKLCDFGSAKMGFSAALAPPGPTRKHLITGSPGYVDPHYLRTGISSKKNDMYSFGVVLMELLTGLEAFCLETGRMLTSRVVSGSGDVNPDLIDPRLGSEYDAEESRVMSQIAATCVRGSPSLRPSASEVVAVMRQHVRVTRR
uniref:Protein kinase domain-containing protein n=1 Tax=Kalanchoe fedtschenkoi TaxID=63787 RepID=A0A7N0V1B8_KALFE